MRRRSTVAVALALAAAAALAVVSALTSGTGGDTGDGERACRGLEVASWSADSRLTGEFTRYGDDSSRTDDWTGGDGSHSVRLPDGRVLWLATDPYLDRVHPPPNPVGQPHAWRDTTGGRTPAWVRNATLVMSPSGRLERTLTGGTPAAPASFFPDISPSPQVWRWPMQAVVEPRAPGADEQVVRVLLWDRATGPAPYVYGVPAGTEVATLSLPDLRLEGIVKLPEPRPAADPTTDPAADPARRVLYGTTAVRHGGWTYVFGGDDGRAATPATRSSRAHVARVPAGRLADPAAWRYWDGSRWHPDPARAAPVLGNGGRHGVGSSFTVVREGDTWVLLTMDSGGDGATGLSTVTSYWACSPHGPWHGPAEGFRPPLPTDSAARSEAVVYNPQAHPALGGPGLLLSYDVNVLGAAPSVTEANVNRNVALYRPRFVRLHLGPTR